MSETAISIQNVSKLYRLGEVSTGSLIHDANRWWHRLLGKEDPYLKVGQVNDRTQAIKKQRSENDQDDEWIYALKDVSFNVQKGEVLGLIGRNGAGKSTLLKILSRVTSQTSGIIKVRGRIASLLEVGTGFHPELTGRENIFLNGAILGMRRREIASKMDEIIDFSGCARYIDTPVKRYSSGMYVRLAFAVAAHLDPEILIVDEVLAVGDAEFQKKCIGKMKSVSENLGKTVLFVSHDLESISKLTKNSILFKNGRIAMHADSQSVIGEYLNFSKQTDLEYNSHGPSSRPHIRKVKLHTSISGNIHSNSDPLKIELDVFTPHPVSGAAIFLSVTDSKERNFIHIQLNDSEKPFCRDVGVSKIICEIPKLRLYLGDYKLSVSFTDIRGRETIETIDNICPFKVTMFQNSNSDNRWKPEACAYIEEFDWDVSKC